MELDLKLLSRNLVHAPDGPAVSSEGVNPYLLERIFTPAMNGQAVRVADIDFDAFGEDEIDVLAGYYDQLDQMSRRVREFAVALAGAVPTAGAARAFC